MHQLACHMLYADVDQVDTLPSLVKLVLDIHRSREILLAQQAQLFPLYFRVFDKRCPAEDYYAGDEIRPVV